MWTPSKEDLEKRLLRHRAIDPGTGCWIWTGWARENGQGRICYRRKNTKYRLDVHKVSAHLWLGKALRGKTVVAPVCGEHACFNPEHLKCFKDRAAFARWHWKKTFCIYGRNLNRYKTSLGEALDIRDAIRLGESNANIVKRLGVSDRTVRAIRGKEKFKYIWHKGFDKKFYSGVYGDPDILLGREPDVDLRTPTDGLHLPDDRALALMLNVI